MNGPNSAIKIQPDNGDLSDHESLVKAIRQVDVVISTLGGQQIDDQVKLIAAIKEAGNIKDNYTTLPRIDPSVSQRIPTQHGTSDGCIKAWNVDAKRVVCDLNTTEAFPSVLDIKCSPVEPIFVSAAASGGAGSNYIDNLGFASLTVWNMKTWKAMTVLPLGEDPPAITSLCFNHNGKILAASAVDGMIHMFGILNFVHLIVSLV
ncbi:hypothetical protein JHK87_027183 [Glycine soja]|nr:hypothetical protein JHK87_027183 [Glycine soja]